MLSAPPPRKKRNIEENTSEHQSITLLDLVADDNVLGYILQFIGTDAHSLFRLSWTCRFWRTKLAEDELWHQLLVDLLDGVNWETCVRLCELSGLDCKSLAAAVVSATQPHSVVHEYTEVKEAVDPRNWGIITFMPQRLDNVNDTALFQQAVVDVCRWCVGITKATGKSGQFLWLGQFGRAELLVSYSQSKLVFGLEGESAYILQDRDAFVQDAIDCIGADCCFLKLDVDAPSQLAWMNGDSRIGDTFDDALERISRADISAVVEAGSGFTLGMLYVTCLGGEECGVNYHFRAASAGSRARKVNPMARYAVHKGYHRERHNVHSILWALAATNIPPNVFGDNLDYPCPSDWIGFPFDLEG